MKLVNCGCSFAHGYNSTVLTDYKPVVQKGLATLKVPGYESAGYHLAVSKKMQYIDLARNGNSNEAIARTLRTYLNHNKNEKVFVLIGWTHAFRREYMSWNQKDQKGEFTQYREVPNYRSIFSRAEFHGSRMMIEFNERKNRPLAYDGHIEFRQYNIMLQLQDMFKAKNIPYLMYNGCGSEHESQDREVLEIKDQIDKDHFYNFYGDGYDAYVLKNQKLVSIDGGHPNEKGHKKLAELLEPKFNAILTKFKENDII
jgi:hypothetical protein